MPTAGQRQHVSDQHIMTIPQQLREAYERGLITRLEFLSQLRILAADNDCELIVATVGDAERDQFLTDTAGWIDTPAEEMVSIRSWCGPERTKEQIDQAERDGRDRARKAQIAWRSYFNGRTRDS